MYRIPFAKTALATKVSAVTLTAILMSACGGDSDSNDPAVPADPVGKSLSFTAVKAPETDLESVRSWRLPPLK
jgi:hypothetical protein